MNGYALQEIAKILSGEIVDASGSEAVAGPRSSIDTRTIHEGDIFFALPGEQTDGHRFVGSAFERGAAAAVIARGRENSVDGQVPGNRLVVVKDPATALRELASHHRNRFSPLVFAVTGSNGKTTTKELLAAIAREATESLSSRGNFNNLLGVPLTLLHLGENHEWLVVELGISEPGEMDLLGEMVRPDVAVVTNINAAHVEGLGPREAIAAEKLRLAGWLEGRKRLYIGGDDTLLVESARHRRLEFTTFGLGDHCNFRPASVEAWRREGVRVSLESGRHFDVSLFGEHNACNVVAALAVAIDAGLSDDVIARGLKEFRPPAGRFDLCEVAGVSLVDDSYNANEASVTGAIEFLEKCDGGGKRLLVLGDMLELGDEEENAHRSVGVAAARAGIDRLFLWGDRVRWTADAASHAGMESGRITLTADDPDRFAESINGSIDPGDLVVFKGSRGMEMERFFNLVRGMLCSERVGGEN